MGKVLAGIVVAFFVVFGYRDTMHSTDAALLLVQGVSFLSFGLACLKA